MTMVREHSIPAGSIASCVGCLSCLSIRLADGTSELSVEAPFEIVSLIGTLTPDHVHLHIAAASEDGRVIGGHLLDGCIVNTTAELIIHVYPQLIFSRQPDEQTGYTELVVHQAEVPREQSQNEESDTNSRV